MPQKMTESKQAYPWITPVVKNKNSRNKETFSTLKQEKLDHHMQAWEKFKTTRQKAKEEL